MCACGNRFVKINLSKEIANQSLGFSVDIRRQCMKQLWSCSLGPPTTGRNCAKAPAAALCYLLLDLCQGHAPHRLLWAKHWAWQGYQEKLVPGRQGLLYTDFGSRTPKGFAGLACDRMAVQDAHIQISLLHLGSQTCLVISWLSQPSQVTSLFFLMQAPLLTKP